MKFRPKSFRQWNVHFRSPGEDALRSLSISNARKELLDLPEVVQDEPIYITKHGRPVMALLSVEQFEGLLETLEILTDQTFATRLRRSIVQAEAGQIMTLQDAAARLGL